MFCKLVNLLFPCNLFVNYNLVTCMLKINIIFIPVLYSNVNSLYFFFLCMRISSPLLDLPSGPHCVASMQLGLPLQKIADPCSMI